MPGGINGPAIGAITAGAVFAYAGIKGKSVLQLVQGVVQGKSPASVAQTTAITAPAAAPSTGSPSSSSAGSPASGTTNAQNQALGKQLAAAYGWSAGQEWTDLNNIVEAESGWSDTITNGSSGAAGIAQNISGWSADYQKGNAAQQIGWLLSYIKSRYGDPIAAWAFHLAHGWY